MQYIASQYIHSSSFEIGKFRGVSVTLTNEQLVFHLQQHDVIDYIEENQVVSIGQCEEQNTDDWNLLRTSERLPDLGSVDTYKYGTNAGQDVTAYVLDTGVFLEHNDFGGRAIFGANFADTIDDDCNGHGTHVASILAGALYGIAKKTSIVAVKVLNCAGTGSFSGVITGINWVASNHKKPATSNMSIGAGYSQAINDATNALVDMGVVCAVAAGNSNADACNYSPSSAEQAITVGSSTLEATGPNEEQEDLRSSPSNYGLCIDIFAPGTLIRAAWIGGNDATRILSGSSMASPHAAGVASLILGTRPTLTPAQVEAEIISMSTKDIIDLRCTQPACNLSPNRLLYSSCA